VISSSGVYDYVGRFAYTGTRDYTGLAAIPEALDFCESIGFSVMADYNHKLVTTVSCRLAAAWGTYLLVDPSMCGAMVNIVLPCCDENAVKFMQSKLDDEYGIFVVYKTMDLSGKIYHILRLSAQIYLEEIDFLPLEKLVPQFLHEYSSGR